MKHLTPKKPLNIPMIEIFEEHKKYIDKHIIPMMIRKGIINSNRKSIDDLVGGEKLRVTKEIIHAIHDECSEIMGWLPWKHWKNYTEHKLETEEIKFEIIDLLHFIFNLAFIWNMPFDEIEDYYLVKLKENIRRQEDGY